MTASTLPPDGTQGGAPPSYLAYSILSTLFCCLPLGIVAIVYSSQVMGKISAGDWEGARKDSEKAKGWTWASVSVGIASILLFGIFAVIVEILDKE
jgi:hypothetical protein